MTYLIIAYILNIVDYLFTAHWVSNYGISIEANPIGRWLFSHDIVEFVKIFVIGVLFMLIGYIIKRNGAYLIIAKILLGVFTILTVYHIIIFVRIYMM